MATSLSRHFLILDDHELVLKGTLEALKQNYPGAVVSTAQTVEIAQGQLRQSQPALMVMDLSVPVAFGAPARTENGLDLLRSSLETYSHLNFVVQTAFPKALVRLQPAIMNHSGGFTIVDKSLPIAELLQKVDWSLQGLVYTPREIRAGLDLKPEWIQILDLAFRDGLQDKAIAEQMNVSERTVRNYWTRIQDVLGVYPDEGKNIRIQTQIRAKASGLID